MELNILRASESCMLSPLVFAVKNKSVFDPAQQEFRMCVDLKYVNEITERRSCSIPIIKDSIQLLVGNFFFAKMDLTLGYHQCAVHENSKHLLAICTPVGNFEWNTKLLSFTWQNVLRRRMVLNHPASINTSSATMF